MAAERESYGVLRWKTLRMGGALLCTGQRECYLSVEVTFHLEAEG